MSSRLEEKQRRRAEREELEQTAQVRDRRSHRPRAIAVAAGTLVVMAAIVASLAAKSGENTSRTDQSATGTQAAAFDPHYPGMDARRKAAGVPTMMQTMGSQAHVHANLAVYVDGKPIEVPANIGIAPGADPMSMAGLHTHDASGVIHVEGMDGATLGQLFAVWGVPLAPDRLGSRRQPVQLWVDDKPSRAFARLVLADGQRIVVAVGRPGPPPP